MRFTDKQYTEWMVRAVALEREAADIYDMLGREIAVAKSHEEKDHVMGLWQWNGAREEQIEARVASDRRRLPEPVYGRLEEAEPVHVAQPVRKLEAAREPLETHSIWE